MFDMEGFLGAENPDDAPARLEDMLRDLDRWCFYRMPDGAWEASGAAGYIGYSRIRVALDGSTVDFRASMGVRVPDSAKREVRKFLMATNAAFVVRGLFLEGDSVQFKVRRRLGSVDLDDLLSRACFSIRMHEESVCAIIGGLSAKAAIERDRELTRCREALCSR